MTRINVVPVSEMTQPELAGEWKEIWRVFGYVKDRVRKGHTPADVLSPEKYTLGSGHVTFFYTRLQYIIDRIDSLYSEMIRRGYSPNEGMMVTAIQSAKAEIPSEWFGEYYPTQEAIALNIQRMKDNGTR